MPKVCKTKIFFTSGGGYWTYYLGVAAYIQENYNLESCEFAGVSAGGMAAYILASGMNVREAWEKYYVPYIEELGTRRTKAFGNLNEIAYKRHRAGLEENSQYLEKMQNRVFLGVAKLPFFKLCWISKFENSKELAQALTASHGIPILLGGLRWNFIQTKIGHCVDPGMFFLTRAQQKQYHPPHWAKKDIFFVTPSIWRPLSVRKLWPSASVFKNTQLFEQGYQDAKCNQNAIPLKLKI